MDWQIKGNRSFIRIHVTNINESYTKKYNHTEPDFYLWEHFVINREHFRDETYSELKLRYRLKFVFDLPFISRKL
jgi:hypothetical protein